MHVSSPLADIAFHVGRLERRGDQLVIESRADSSLPVTVTLSRADARQVLGAILASPGAILFGLSALVRRSGGDGDAGADAWRRRRDARGINKPW